MNIFDQQQDLKNFSDDMLVQEGQNPSGRYVLFAIHAEVEDRYRIRNEYEARKAQAELKNPSILEQRFAELQGIPSVDSSAMQMQGQQQQQIQPQMQPQGPPQMQQMAQGGIVGYADGGSVGSPRGPVAFDGSVQGVAGIDWYEAMKMRARAKKESAERNKGAWRGKSSGHGPGGVNPFPRMFTPPRDAAERDQQVRAMEIMAENYNKLSRESRYSDASLGGLDLSEVAPDIFPAHSPAAQSNSYLLDMLSRDLGDVMDAMSKYGDQGPLHDFETFASTPIEASVPASSRPPDLVEQIEEWRQSKNVRDPSVLDTVRSRYDKEDSDMAARRKQLENPDWAEDSRRENELLMQMRAGNQREQEQAFLGRVSNEMSPREQALFDARKTPEQMDRSRRAIALSGLGALIGGATRRGQIAQGMAPITQDIMSLRQDQEDRDLDLMTKLGGLEEARLDRNFQYESSARASGDMADESIQSIGLFNAGVSERVQQKLDDLDNARLQLELDRGGREGTAAAADAEISSRNDIAVAGLEYSAWAKLSEITAALNENTQPKLSDAIKYLEELGAMIRPWLQVADASDPAIMEMMNKIKVAQDFIDKRLGMGGGGDGDGSTQSAVDAIRSRFDPT
jgi:hypothetical protein